MPLATIGAGLGAAQQIPGVGGAIEDGIGKVTGVVDGIGGKVESLFGSNEKVKGIPAGVPNEPQTSGPIAGAVFQGGTGDGTPFNKTSMKLRPGLYNYDDLSAKGLNDQISGVKVEPGFTVYLYKGVENGKPAGDSVKIEGPAQIPELRDFQPGFENAVSAIAVKETGAGQTGTGGNTGTGQTGTGGSSDTPESDAAGPGALNAGFGQIRKYLFTPVGVVLVIAAAGFYLYDG